jgi:pyruvate/2-oxoglutarate dehydrogenase complex dihydrolipoamide dehydrogenase (E3) component
MRRHSSRSSTASDVHIAFDVLLLVAVGRVANTTGYGLERTRHPDDARAHRSR